MNRFLTSVKLFRRYSFRKNLTSHCLYRFSFNRRFRLPLQERGAFYGYFSRRQ
jgi:hypothetical protein